MVTITAPADEHTEARRTNDDPVADEAPPKADSVPASSEARRWNVNPVAVTVGVSAAAIIVSLFLLTGQLRADLSRDIDANQIATATRIDSLTAKIDANQTATATRIDSLTAKIDANQTATNARLDTTNARLDSVLLTLPAIGAIGAIGDLVDGIEALRADVAKLAAE